MERRMLFLIVAIVAATLYMLKCNSSECYESLRADDQGIYTMQSNYPSLIYNQPPLLPPGSQMGLQTMPPVQVNGTYDTQNPTWIAGPIDWNINV